VWAKKFLVALDGHCNAEVNEKKRILTIEGLLKGFDVDEVVPTSTEERVDTSVIANNIEICEQLIPAWPVAEATVAVSVDPLRLNRPFRNPTLWQILIT